MSKIKSLIIGIDLGTVNSCMAIYDGENLKILETRDGKTTPSFVFFDPKSNDVMVGETGMTVKREFENGLYDSKRFIGRKFCEDVVQTIHKSYPFRVVSIDDLVEFEVTKENKKTCIKPQEVSAEILKYFVQRLKADYDFEEIKAVITVPAYFNNSQRTATMEAAKLAGINVLLLMNEPTAAALYYFHVTKDQNKTAVVFDLGGGTFDVSIVKKSNDDISVLSIDGDGFLGGRDLDEEIFKYFMEDFKEKGIDLSDVTKKRLKSLCEKIKVGLSKKDHVYSSLDSYNDDDDDLPLELERETFNQLSQKAFDKCIYILDRCLKERGITKDDIDDVVLIGGSTKILKLQEMISQYFDGKEIKKIINPDTAVAAGASIRAYTLCNKTIPKADDKLNLQDLHKTLPGHSIHITDVTTFSIGTGVFFNGMEWAVERNTPIPLTKSIKLSTTSNNQTFAEIDVYEGRWNYKMANNYLGSILIDNLPMRPRGEVIINIEFDLDENNILSVTAIIESTGIRKLLSVSLTQGNNSVPVDTNWDEEKDLTFEKIRMLKSIAYQFCDDYIFNNEADTKSCFQCSEFKSKLPKISYTDMNELKNSVTEFLSNNHSQTLKMQFTRILSLFDCDLKIIKYEYNKC